MASECVKVMVRCRPMNSKEQTRGCQSICGIDKSTNQVIIRPNEEGGPAEKIFAYDSVYGPESTQQQVYDETAFPLVESVIRGFNGTMFAYGQTGCGKTHTMVGYPGTDGRGIIPNAFAHIYGYIDDQANVEKKFLVRCAFVEIYNEEIRDLLGPDPDKKLDLKEQKDKGVFVKDLSIITATSIREIEVLMDKGNSLRKTGQTAMNDTSSRSHSLFTIYIETAELIQGKQRYKSGKLNLVDLAGSERQSKTQATGIRLKEATKINLSLSALGNVISALVDGRQSHIPYRDSKLTRLLQDSLGGNTKTVMMAAISPADYNLEETLSTLRYASRAKAIKNKPRVNEDPKDALLAKYEDEIKRLKAMLEAGGPAAAAIKPQAAVAGGDSNQANIEAALNGGRNQGSTENLNVERRETLREETVEQLLEKLHKKGQNVKVVEEDKELEQQQSLERQKEEMAQLQQLMASMENQLVKGGEALEVAEKTKAHEQRLLQLQLEEERQVQNALQEERERVEQEMMERDKQYNSLQEEVDAQREIIKKLRQKYQQAESELNAVTRDQNDNRAELTDTIRDQEKDLDFLNAIVSMMLKEGEMYRLKEKIEYDFEGGKWKVPPFIIKNKEVNFPKIKMAGQLVRDTLEQREVVMAETGEVLDEDGNGSGNSRYGRNGIPNTFKGGQQSSSKIPSRQRPKRVDRHMSGFDNGGSIEGIGSNSYYQSQGLGDGGGRQAPVEGNQLGGEFYNSSKKMIGERHSSSSSGEVGGLKYGRGPGNENVASQMNMKRNESDFGVNGGVQKTVQHKANKYNSIERGSMFDENEKASPMIMKKKANVHLEPMSHKKAHMLQGQPGMAMDAPMMPHSESNPLLQPPVINDRVKLEKLNHIPSVKSNLMQVSDNMSQSGIDTGYGQPGLNYEAMPVGKKSVLAPINMMNTQLANDHPVLSKIEAGSSIMNRKNNRTLKPLKR